MTPGLTRSRLLAILAALSLVLALAVPASAAKKSDPPGQLIDVQLLAFNDYHGHLEASTPGAIYGVQAGGAEYLAAKLAELRAGHKFSLTVAAGDLIGGSPAFSGLFHDEPSVESLNALGLDVSSVGNHEFDEGVTELLRMQNGGCHPVDGCYFPGQPYAGADFQWLAANVIETASGQTPLPPYWIKKFNNVKVGFIGMTLEGTDELVAAAGIVGYEFLDEAETANALVPILQAQGVEAIVVLLHEGGSQTPPPGDVNACVGISGPVVSINAALDPAIDAMITGHTHLPYNCVLEGRMVTSAYSFGRVVTEMNLVLDKRTKDVRRDLSSAQNHIVDQSQLSPHPALTAVIDKWMPLFAEAGNTPVGTITETIFRNGASEANPGADDRGVESPLSNLIADAQLWATSANGAQVAFMNPGGVRANLLYPSSPAGEGDGVVTFAEAFAVQPFGNTLITFPMTGAQITSVLEEQCQPAGSSRPFLHLGVPDNFSYDLAWTLSGGNCTSITVSNVMLNGAPLTPGTTYMVTVNNFLADGGDNFDTFEDVAGPRIDGGNDLEAFMNFLGTFSPVSPPSTDRVNELP